MKIKDALHDVLSRKEQAYVTNSFDRIGDIALVTIAPELFHKEHIIAQTLLQLHPNIHVVAKRAGKYGGEFRTLPITLLAGEKRTETIHKEHGVQILVNLEQVYFSVRLGEERKRIAGLVQPGERIAVLCSGVSPYPLVISKHSQAREIIGIEKNILAHGYARKNLLLNKKCNNITLYHGDVEQVLPQLDHSFDRVIIMLPTAGKKLILPALQSLRPGGWLHYYSIENKGDFNAALVRVQNISTIQKQRVSAHRITSCGHTSPQKYRICIDARIQPMEQTTM